MSKDIRSFFTVLSKKPGDAGKQQKPKKAAVILDSDEEDVIENTPKKTTKVSQTKRRAAVLSSDSEEEGKSKKRSPLKKPKLSPSKPKKEDKPKLKPVDLDFFNKPIKQSEIKHVPKQEVNKSDEKKKDKSTKKKKKGNSTEIGVHNDKAFEKTLKDLDDDSDDTILLDNLDILDKTIEEAVLSEHINKNVKSNPNTPKSNGKQKSTEKQKSNEKSKSMEKPKSIEEPKSPDHIKLKVEKLEDTPRKRTRKTSESTPTSTKKPKLEHTDSGVDNDFEKWERKRQSAGLYVAYLHRGGPKHHGEKEYPKGKPDCLKGLIFLRTGVLDSLEGDEFENLVTDHGGRIVHSVSKKVNYVVVGDEPGPAKLEKARKYKLPEINEDQFLDMILEKSGMKPKYCVKSESSEDFGFGGSEELSSVNSENDIVEEKNVNEVENGSNHDVDDVHVGQKPNLKRLVEKVKEQKDIPIKEEPNQNNELKKSPQKEELSKKELPSVTTTQNGQTQIPENINKISTNMSWTDKYKPTNSKGIIGQQDTNSNMNKLKRWLENWFKNLDSERRKKLPRPTLYNQYDGAYFKAALLSGSPGVGKTTTATLVAKELGFDIVEFNASDTRNKKLLHEEISQMMGSKTVAAFASGQKNINQKRVLLMDEVDGMAGNEDRGGIAELINFIKTASFPIICMCNNRDLPKMRSLVNHCYALKFGKPNMVQVRGAMLSICFKEGLSIKPDVLAQLITGTGCDIRQTLNHLSMWSAAEKNLTAETVQKDSKHSQKDVVFGAWDVIRKVFNKSENKDMTLADKSRLFFYDYSFGPMFVQENYLTVEPECTGVKESKSLEILIRRQLAADCLSRSDLIESKIRSTNNWSLLESQAFLSTVLASYYLSGKMGQVRFPGWFGKNSQRKKSLRMVSELYAHARTSISGDKTSVRLDYAEPLMKRLITPLKEKQAAGIDETLEVMKRYTLLRDDLTNLCDLMTSFDNKRSNPFDSVSSSVKSALTRKYNKTMVLSFAPPTASKKKKTAGTEQEDFLGEEDDYSDEEADEDNVDTDALIKVKNKASTQASSSKASGSKKDTKSKGKSTDSKSSKSSKKK